VLYVEMTSTGESACLGDSLEEAWLKAAIANGLRLPHKSLLVSIGGDDAKQKLLEPLRQLAAAGFEIHATPGTSRFLDAQDVKSHLVRKVSDQEGSGVQGFMGSGSDRTPGTPDPQNPVLLTSDVVELIADRKVECVINIPKRTADETVLTDGYRIRRAAADFGIPLINDTELARLFIRTLLRYPRPGLDAKPLAAYAARTRPPDSVPPRC
jgi:carbamoyl-phosphate synthase large subunit